MTAPIVPDEPATASGRGSGRLSLRYEDVSQSGHLVLEAIPHALTQIWRSISTVDRDVLGREPGVIPILSRVAIEGGEGPIGVLGAHEAEGVYQVSHTVADDGSIDRIILAMWGKVTSVIGRTQGPAPPDAGRAVTAGRIFAEHVFTRPFGPPERRKVRALSVGGRGVVPEARYVRRDPGEILAVPDGAAALDGAPLPDGAETVFGLDHTDSNSHVNSLVYTRIFIEAALRRLHHHGLGGPGLLARSIEIAYRRPCFSGERARVHVRVFTAGEAAGAIAALASDEGPARPRAIARMLFAR